MKEKNVQRVANATVEKLQANPPMPVDLDLVFSRAEKAVVVAGVAALVVIAGVGLRLAWLFTHLDSDPAMVDAFEGGGDTHRRRETE